MAPSYSVLHADVSTRTGDLFGDVVDMWHASRQSLDSTN